jgi:hypothetical protein
MTEFGVWGMRIYFETAQPSKKTDTRPGFCEVSHGLITSRNRLQPQMIKINLCDLASPNWRGNCLADFGKENRKTVLKQN